MNTPTGFTKSDWFQLLRDVKHSVDRKYLSRAFQVTVFSYLNSRYLKQEKRMYEDGYSKAEIKQPIFILGHWRNGTTLLHELMAADPQFAYPNLFEISRPHTFLFREPFIEQQAAQPASTPRPMDNMLVNFRSPGEDESALSVLSLRSPMLAWMFPRYEEHFDRYLIFEDASAEDLARWKNAIVLFMKKLTFRYNRPLLMKSPTHTARINILLDLFPDARFIHLHRDPFTVYQSTLKLYDTAVKGSHLQDRADGSSEGPGIIRRYQKMYAAFFEQRKRIPADQYVEIAFEDLDKDKIGAMREIYARLGLPGYENALPGFEAYLKRTENYQKNQHKPLPEPLRSELAGAWAACFEEWGYSSK